jgi:solute carrier family 8 (sodium/calcium exchanger)
LENEITAITLVALGTSLPDTFASKAAAINDDTADASIGNVTGSNSVNVFLGLGLPWLMAAVRWSNGNPGLEWYNTVPAKISTEYPDGVFYVSQGDLGVSVVAFSCCSISCIALLFYRRQAYGAELGGPNTKLHAAFLLFLWLVYVTISSVNSYSNQ